MPRAKKRKAADFEYDEPLDFIAMYCDRRNIPFEIGNSLPEKECIRLAQEAREEYKSRRDGVTGRRPPPDGIPRSDDLGSIDRKGLSPAQKYTIRLHNNRKSADASKVYNEVLKREQAYRLSSSADPHNLMGDSKIPFIHPSTQKLLTQQQQRIQELEKVRVELKGRLDYETMRGDKLHKQVQDLQQQQFHQKMQQRAHNHQQHLQVHHPPHMPQQQIPPPPTPMSSSQHPSQHTSGSQSQPNSQPLVPPQMIPNQDSQPHSESQPPQESGSQQPLSLHQRLVSSRGLMQPWSLSPMQQESDGKDFHTGLTCSQSQNEEVDDKGPLIRTSMPLSSGLQIGLLGSQPSQSDMPAFKSTMGSDDLPLPPDPEFFLGSQGTSKGRAS